MEEGLLVKHSRTKSKNKGKDKKSKSSNKNTNADTGSSELARQAVHTPSGATSSTTTTTVFPNTAPSESEAASILSIQPAPPQLNTAADAPHKVAPPVNNTDALFGALRRQDLDAVQTSEVPMEYHPDQSIDGHILYPSVPMAPSAPAMVAFDDHPLYPSLSADQYPAEYNDLTAADVKSEYAQSKFDRDIEMQLADAINTPSAPPIHLMLNETVPLDDAVLANMYVNAELQNQYATIVDDFRKSAKYVLARDIFFENVLNYERSFSTFQSSSTQLSRLLPTIESISQRVWTLKKTHQTLTARCEDGVHLVHIVSSETAHLNLSELEKLRETLTKTLADCIYAKKRAAFDMKMIKLWIQTYLDEHLNQLDKALSTLLEENDSKASTDASSERLKYFLDVLFFFERRKDSSDPAVNNPGTSFGAVTASMPPVLADSTAFIRDIRGWISHVVGLFHKIAHQHIGQCSYLLLHVIRCSGIGLWGNWFVQWHPPNDVVWSDRFLDAYLTNFHIFLSPIEEMQEEQRVKDIENEFIVKSLRKLEELEEWVVVKEADVMDRDMVNSNLTVLSDDDYAAFFGQFNVEAMYHSFLQSSLGLYKSDAGVSLTGKDWNFLRLFSVTNFMLERLSNGLFLFSSRRYTRILKNIGKTVVNLVKILEDAIKAVFGNSQQQLNVPLVVNSTVSTTVQSELDGSFVRAVGILLNRTRAGSWENLTNLPCALLSDHMKFHLVNAILYGEGVNVTQLRKRSETAHSLGSPDDVSLPGISIVMASNRTEAKYLLSFLARLSTTGSDAGYQNRLKEIVAKVIFHFGFLDPEYRQDLQEARGLLASIAASLPSVMSLLVTWTRKNFALIGPLGKYLFSGLPLEIWCPTTSDFDSFVAMLRDPVKSDKFELGKCIIESLNWGVKTDSDGTGDLYIPRSFHRFLALSLCNLYLDRFMKVPMFSVSSALSTTAAISKGNLGALIPVNDSEFYDWCWMILLEFSLYQPPTSQNMYTMLESNVGSRIRPFEVLESAQLATLRGAMKSKSLAAFTLLMISDVGHSVAAFEKDGWAMMQILLDDGRYEAIVCVVNTLLASFVQTEGINFASGQIFSTFFATFMKSSSRIKLTPTVLQKGTSVGYEAPAPYWILLWIRVAFADSDWMHNRSSVQLLDSLSKIAILYDQWHIVCASLRSEYTRLLLTLKKPANAYAMSAFAPMDSLKAVATSIGDYLSLYPTLVVGSGAAWYYATIPSTIRRSLLQIPSETEFTWYAVLALVAESEIEADLRMEIGNALSKDSQTLVSEVSKVFGKPMELFSIYRVAALISDSDGVHPTLPLLIQIFFSLYFENARNPIVNMNSCFGFRFFIDNRSLLDKLSKKLSQRVADLTAVDPKGDILLFKPAERDHLATLLKASLKWLLEPRLLSSNIFMGNLDASYCIHELNSIMHQAPCLFNDLWIDRVPVLALREGLQQINSSRRFSVSSATISRSPSEQFYVHETSLPGMPWISRNPVVTPPSQMSLAQATTILKDDFQVLLLKSRDAHKVHRDYLKSDTEYLAKLALLYVNYSKSNGRHERKCSTACMGAAQFRYTFDEVVLKRDVKQALKDNRSHFETLSEWDNVDSRVCLSALKLVCVAEWASSDVTMRESQAVDTLLVPFFFKVMALAPNLRSYPPMAFVLDRCVQTVGALFISNSREHTVRLFEVLKSSVSLASAADAFKPSVATDLFCDMYLEFASQPERSITLPVLRRFSVSEWLALCGEANQFQFLEMLGGLFENVKADQLHIPEDQMEVHMDALSQYLGHEAIYSTSKIVEAVVFIADGFILSKIPDSVFTCCVTALNLRHTFSANQIAGYELQDVLISRNFCVEILDQLNIRLETFSMSTSVGVYGMDDARLHRLVDLEALLFCSKPLHSMLSEVQKLETVSHLRRSLNVFFGLMTMDGSKIGLKVWLHEDGAKVEIILQTFLRVASKTLRLLCMADGICLELWNIVSHLVSLNSPDYMISTIRKVIEPAPWNNLIISSSVAFEIWNWSESDCWSPHLQAFAGYILSTGVWSPIYEPRLLQVCFRIFASSGGLPENENNRVQMLNSLEAKVLGMVAGYQVDYRDLEAIFSALPGAWDENLTSISKTSQSSPLGRVLQLGRAVLKSNGSRVDDLKLLYSYIFELVRRQVCSHDESCQTFSVADLSAIIPEIFQQVYSADPQSNAVLSHCIEQLYTTINSCSRESFTHIWKGAMANLEQSSEPMVWLSRACTHISSLELMPILVEKAIEAQLIRMKHMNWEPIVAVLVVPEFGQEAFVSNCLQHAHVFTLYAMAVQSFLKSKMTNASCTPIGEQVAIWISTLNTDALVSVNGNKLKDEKLLFLLDIFSQLVSVAKAQEHYSASVLHQKSRLYSTLPNVAEQVLRFGEPSNQGLWTTLGFGFSRSQLSAPMRVFCKGWSTFVAMRLYYEDEARNRDGKSQGDTASGLRGDDEMSEISERRSKFVSQVSSLSQKREYADCEVLIDGMVAVLEDETKTVYDMRACIGVMSSWMPLVESLYQLG
ncbi:Ectopic P granules protein 5 [Chytriomyces hyalinus]|nr:Ectopic P granules protein 5 [Chytriomyces hyalinus]